MAQLHPVSGGTWYRDVFIPERGNAYMIQLLIQGHVVSKLVSQESTGTLPSKFQRPSL